MAGHVIAAVLAALLGFTAHRAGVCTVKAVAEFLTTRRIHMLASFFKTSAWAVLVLLPLGWAQLSLGTPFSAQGATWTAVAGGFVFGVGAVVNGGCAVSTVTRLGNGDTGMVLTLAGMAAGIGLSHAYESPFPQFSPLASPTTWAWGLLGLVALWAVREARTLWKSRSGGVGDFLISRHWRLSVSAVVLGATSGMVFALEGPWSYGGLLRDGVAWGLFAEPPPKVMTLILFCAMVGGVVASALMRGSFQLRWPAPADTVRFGLGGMLMGLGSVLIPWGNDVLVLYALPVLSPHAFVAYPALVVGAAATLVALRKITGKSVKIECTGDICHTEGEPRAS